MTDYVNSFRLMKEEEEEEEKRKKKKKKNIFDLCIFYNDVPFVLVSRKKQRKIDKTRK